jgi:hypothetical protein
MGKVLESHIKSTNQFSIRGRTKFGDPNEKSMNKTTANEPGPGQYDLYGRFLGGTNPRKCGFSKAGPPKERASVGPGPGSYKPVGSMGKQVMSTKKTGDIVGFSKAPRPSMAVNSCAPGPGQYKPGPSACDPQVQSNKMSCGSIKFGEGYKKGKGLLKFDAAKYADPSPG